MIRYSIYALAIAASVTLPRAGIAQTYWSHLETTADSAAILACRILPRLDEVAGQKAPSSAANGLSASDNDVVVASAIAFYLRKLMPAAASQVLRYKTSFEERDPPTAGSATSEALLSSLDEMYKITRTLGNSASEAQSISEGKRLQGQASSAAQSLRDQILVYTSARRRLARALGRSSTSATFKCPPK